MTTLAWAQALTTSEADGSTLTAAAAASMLPAQAKFTIPAGELNHVGKAMRITAAGRISSLITTPGTARFDVRLGGTVIFDSLAILLDTVAAHTTKGWWLDILLILRANGTAANFFGSGKWICEDILGTPATMPKADGVAVLPWDATPAVGGNFDATAAQQLDVFFTQTVATGSLTCHMFMVETLN